MAVGPQSTTVTVRTTCRKIQNTLYFARSVFMCVSYFQNKQRMLPQAPLTCCP